MGRASFRAAVKPEKPWWFTKEEVQHLDLVRAFRSRPGHVWDMKDASFSRDIDVIAIKSKNHCVSLSKRMDAERGQPVYDIAPDGERARTFKSFSELEMVLARALQLRTSLDYIWGRIEAAIQADKLTPN